MKHAFTAEETARGVMASKLSRKGIARTMKKITGMEIEGETLDRLLAIIQAWVTTPFGSLVIGFAIVNLLAKAGVLSDGVSRNPLNPTNIVNDVTVLKGIEVMGAVFGSGGGAGQSIASGVVSTVGGLAKVLG